MTADELRSVETFLDLAAAHGVRTLDGARLLLSATIAGTELHESEPARTLDEVEMVCVKFLDGRNT
ncbi:MAG: hypothetical protein WAN23_08545 [Candidatus Acidiferrales bacterium]